MNAKPSRNFLHSRAPIARTLFALMFAQVLLAIILISVATSWTLGRGFSEFLRASDSALLGTFADQAGVVIEQAGGLDEFRRDPAMMRRVLDRVAQQSGMESEGPAEMMGPPLGDWASGADAGALPPPPEGAPGREPRSPAFMPPAQGRARPDNFGGRVAIFAPNGARAAGFELPRGAQTISREIRIHGSVVAIAKAVPPSAPKSIEVQFLRSQIAAIAVSAATLLALSMLASWLIARNWAKPLEDIQVGTSRIADGDLQVVLPERGAREIAQTVININSMTMSLQRLESARRRWLADISHELRTPVTVLRGELESLLDGIRPISQQAIQSLHEETIAVARLLDDLHLVSMADLGKIHCEQDDLDGVAILQRSLERFVGIATGKGLSLNLEGDMHPAPFVGDAKRLEQVIGNLLQNSLAYTDAPGRVVLSVRRAGPDVSLRIDDSAPAPPDDEIQRLFEPFYRAEGAPAKVTGGSGLGLAVCRAIVEAHGGSIRAERSDLGGLAVEVRLRGTGRAQNGGPENGADRRGRREDRLAPR